MEDAPRTLGQVDEEAPDEPVEIMDPLRFNWEEVIALEEQATVNAECYHVEDKDGWSTREAIALQWIYARRAGSEAAFAEYIAQPVIGTEIITPTAPAGE